MQGSTYIVYFHFSEIITAFAFQVYVQDAENELGYIYAHCELNCGHHYTRTVRENVL